MRFLSIKTYPGTDYYRDYYPMAAKFKQKLEKTRRKANIITFDLALLKSNQILREKYYVAVQNTFEVLEDAEEVDQQ